MPAYALLLVAALIQNGAKPPGDSSPALVGNQNPLHGLDGFAIVTEEPGPGAAGCNVTRDALELSVARRLLDANVRVDQKFVPFVHVSVAVLATSNTSCAATVDVSAHSPAVASLAYRSNDRVSVDVLLWSTGTLLAGPSAGFGQRVDAAVRDFVGQFAALVKLANQK